MEQGHSQGNASRVASKVATLPLAIVLGLLVMSCTPAYAFSVKVEVQPGSEILQVASAQATPTPTPRGRGSAVVSQQSSLATPTPTPTPSAYLTINTDIDFGFVFPGETDVTTSSSFFTVSLSDEALLGCITVLYHITAEGDLTLTPSSSVPYLTVVLDPLEGEPDIPASASLTNQAPADISDKWIVKLTVPDASPRQAYSAQVKVIVDNPVSCPP